MKSMSVYLRLMENVTTLIETKQLPEYLRSVGTGCRFISLLTETEIDMRKTNNPFVGTIKRSRRNGLINVNYSEGIRRRMMEKGVNPDNHVPGNTWYVHEQTNDGKPLPLCQSKKDNSVKYLQYYPHRSYETEYLLDNVPLSPREVELMKTFIHPIKHNDFKPLVITLKMSSILWIKFRKVKTVVSE